MGPPEVLRAKVHTSGTSSAERQQRWPKLVAAPLLGGICIALLSFGPLLLRRPVFLTGAVITEGVPVRSDATVAGGNSTAPGVPDASNRSAVAESLPPGPLTNPERAAGGDGFRADQQGLEKPLIPAPRSSAPTLEATRLGNELVTLRTSNERPTPGDELVTFLATDKRPTGMTATPHLTVRRRTEVRSDHPLTPHHQMK